MNTYIKGILITSFASILFGLNPLFIHFLQTSNMNLLWTLIVRFVGSSFVFYLIVSTKKIKIDFNKNYRVLFKIFICALFFMLTSVFLVYSYSRIPSGMSTVLHFSYPIIITLMSVKAKRNKFSIALAISIFLSISGVILVTNTSKIEIDVLGIILALLSAVTFSIYLFVLNDNEVRKIDNNVFVLYLNIFASLILLVASIFIFDDFIQISSVEISLISLSGMIFYILASAVGVLLFSYGTRTVGGPVAGTIGAFEPLTAVLVGIVYFNEKSSSYYAIGVSLILLSTIILSLFSSKSERAREVLAVQNNQ